MLHLILAVQWRLMPFFVTQKFKNHIKIFNRILKAFDEDILDFYDGNYDFEII